MSLLLWPVLIYMGAVTCSTSWKLARLGCPALLMCSLLFLQAVFLLHLLQLSKIRESTRVERLEDSQGQG